MNANTNAVAANAELIKEALERIIMSDDMTPELSTTILEPMNTANLRVAEGINEMNSIREVYALAMEKGVDWAIGNAVAEKGTEMMYQILVDTETSLDSIVKLLCISGDLEQMDVAGLDFHTALIVFEASKDMLTDEESNAFMARVDLANADNPVYAETKKRYLLDSAGFDVETARNNLRHNYAATTAQALIGY
ncbi:hypothetical protein [Vibrio sp. WXL210]|uniref:hypothetical protein n=1 Tax=Vibrio sp. WXL210 TaxID=3450709 RepID=UPI003EC63793